MPPPLVVGALLLFKKLLSVAAYQGIKDYGVPRAFRRCLEANKRLTPAAQQRVVAVALKQSFRAPADAAHALMRSDTLQFFQRWIAERDPVLLSLVSRVGEATPLGAWVGPLAREFTNLAAEAEKRRGGGKGAA
jgi:hypothetical protein